MTERPDLPVADLARAGFTRTKDSAAVIGAIVQALPGQVDVDQLVADLGSVADPDQAALAMVRLIERDSTSAKALAAPGDRRLRVLRVLGASTALADHLVKHPEHLDDAASGAAHEPSGVVDAVRGLTGRAGAEALRVAYRQQIVRIAAADLSAQDPLEVLPQVAEALADLASAAIQAALLLANAQVADSHHAKVTVIGMGKCGGRELNYISDVDVIFLAAPASG
ncbi:MAG: bifunctional glutamine-synthetase adenylyltransferase/deadenyltransferase, partial [Ornithinimicrobium sp.]